MTLMEKLQELSATTGRRNEGEDLGHWADREKEENLWVRELALPKLLAVVKAAKEYVEKDKEYLALINPRMQYDIEKLLGLQQAMDKLRAALAALEVEA